MGRSWLAVSVCGVVAILAASVWAQQGPQRGLAERFKQLDKNGDGKISATEFPGPLFKQMDTNGDGFVTMEEARAYYRGRASRQPAGGPPNAASPTQVNAPTGPAPATPPVSASRVFTDLSFTRDVEPGTRDDRGKWIGGTETMQTHVDAVTKVAYLFGGSTKSGSIFRAVYDAASPGRIRWYEEPELSGTGRVMCMAKAFGVPTLRGPSRSAYNHFLPVTDPDTGEKVHLLGLWVNHPAGRSTDLSGSAWYLIRHADGTYGHGREFDPGHARPNPPRGLLATRTIDVSPFPEDKGRVLYFGGYDCANIESHNTAWIYRGTLPDTKKHRP